MNQHFTPRQSERIPVTMSFSSDRLPTPPVELVDLSDEGAKIRLPGLPEPGLEQAWIPAKVSLPCNSQALFEGVAQVIWTRKIQGGAEVGLQWTVPTANSWKAAKALLLGE